MIDKGEYIPKVIFINGKHQPSASAPSYKKSDIINIMRRECMVYNNTLPFKLFQRNLIRRLSLLGVNQISINLCRGDILMRQHLRYCVNVCA